MGKEMGYSGHCKCGAHSSAWAESQRDFDQAQPDLLLSIQEGNLNSYRALAACYAHIGRLDDARATIQRLRDITTVVVPDWLPYRKPEHRKLFVTGLRLAMGEAE
jgi:adenylate cyclase